MKDEHPIAAAPQPDASKPAAPLPWFTADELPLPPPEMRRPPEEEEATLFDEDEEE